MATKLTALLLLTLLHLTLSAPVVWIGGVTSTTFTIHLDVAPAVTSIILSTSPTGDPELATRERSDPTAQIGDPLIYKNLRRYKFTDLQPRTKYFVLVRFPEALFAAATIRTFPVEGTKVDLAIALASCQWFPKLDTVFTDIRQQFNRVESEVDPIPFFFLHMGDFHYRDIIENDVSKFEAAMRPVLERPRVHGVFSRMPVPYMYDDHDYGANNAGFDSPSRAAALLNYRAMVPNYPLSTDDDASFHAFTVGTVRFIITDVRANAGREPGSMFGLKQREWFFGELEAANTYDVVVWMSGKPWIGRVGSTSILDSNDDSWAAFPEERMLIANKISELGVTNMVMVAGDAHMLAADDGTNSDYSNPDDGVPAGFPVFQAAPLGHIASAKGGPYSEGCKGFRLFPNFHYGLLNITRVGEDDGPCVEFLGLERGEKTPLIQFKKCGKLGGVVGSGGQDVTCPLELFPPFISGVFQDFLARCGLIDIPGSEPDASCPFPLGDLPTSVLQLIRSLIQMLFPQ